MIWKGIIDRYRQFLPVTAKSPIVSLNEGNTPLVYSDFLSDMVGGKTEVYLKFEGLNPTASFKDRGMTLAVSKALEAGSKAIICASTGNTSASAAAYAAKAGLKCVVLVPKGNVAMGKMAQALIHGAKVIMIKGNFDDALKLVKDITAKYPITLVNSLNPYRIEGQKTAAFEICDQLDWSCPDYHFIPVGNAGNITAYWKGYKEYKQKGKIKSLPRMMGFQAEGAAPIVKGKIIKNPKTVATAIRIGNPASWKNAEAARVESGGVIDMVSDKEIIEAYRLLASKAGLFVEPASAASVAGLIKYAKRRYFSKEEKYALPPEKQAAGKVRRIICVLTGHGLKDPDRAIKSVNKPVTISARLKPILKEMGLK
ncbi:MAG: threonine synthase [Candidatus Omnitrophica bacterium CG1_02_49_10]|nr:MAG: threonine synthase [Candidatus Omnitrophica bacterium CG1_02_49_10]